MKHKYKTFGMDIWEVREEMYHVLAIIKKTRLSIYELQLKKDTLSFHAPVYARSIIAKEFPHAKLLKTTGMLGFLFRQIRQPIRVIAFITCLFIWYILSNTIFEITIQSDHNATKDIIHQTLVNMQIQPPTYKKNLELLKNDLRKTLEHDIAWMELRKEGSHLFIQATRKQFAQLEELKENEITAQKDGVIVSFDVQHGNKLVNINDKVKKGDVLISNTLFDSSNQPKQVFVKGRVFAHTWHDVSVEMKENAMPNVFHFFQLLLEARREVSKCLQKDESIIHENILQFEKNEGKIRMNIHYILLEDITIP